MMRSIAVVLMLLLAMPVMAQFDTIDTTRQSVAFSLAGQNGNSTTAATASVPIERIDGYVGAFLSRQTADSAVTSEVANVRVQGRYDFVEGYVDTERDIHRGIGFQVKLGYFLVPPSVTWRGAVITGGAGNHTSSTTVKDDLGIEDPDAVDFGWTAFTTVVWKATRSTLIVEPDIRFRDIELEAVSSVSQQLSEDVKVGATFKALFDSDPFIEGKFHTQYLLFASWSR